MTFLASCRAGHLLPVIASQPCVPLTLPKALEEPQQWGGDIHERVFKYWVYLESCLKYKNKSVSNSHFNTYYSLHLVFSRGNFVLLWWGGMGEQNEIYFH